MREGVLYSSLAMLIGLRMLMLVRSWRLPSTLVPGKFFGLPLKDSTRRPLAKKYRLLILIACAVELPIAVGVWSWSGLDGLLIEQFVSLVVFRIYHSLVGVLVIRQAKQAAESESWKPVRSMALFLSTRRLRDFTDMRFEVGLPLFTIALFGIFIYQLSRALEAPHPLLVERAVAFGLLAIYLQLGGLLIKQSLVKWRWRVPGKRVEEYQVWREAVLRYWLWVCDYFRCILSVALLSFVANDLLSETQASDRTILSIRLGVAGLIIGAGIVGLGRQQKRLRTLWHSLTPIEDFSLPHEPIAKAGFILGGLGYWNADNPALFVPGPFVYALNLANRRSYLFAAYLTILVPLAIWCGCSQRAHGADDMATSHSEGTSSLRAEDHTISPRALQQVDRSVQQLIDDDEAVGAEVLILQHGKVLLHKAYGWSDLDRQTPLASNTIACIRSMTKPLVGTAIQMLIDEGKLALTDRVSKFLPSFANEKSQSITVEQLLTHTAGFPLTLMDKPLSGYSDQKAVIDQIGRLGPKTAAGKFVYSDCDTETLAAIVSKIAGEPSEEFIRKRILEPLQMNDTFCVLGNDRPARERVSSNHAGSPGLWHKYWDRDEKPFFPFFLGAASAYSTTQDYAKFLKLWLDRGKLGERRLLSEAAVDRALKPAMMMLSPGTEAPYPTGLSPLQPYYGQHWMVHVDPKSLAREKSVRAFGHSGSDGTLAVVFPEQELMALYFTQSRGGMSVFRFEEMLAPLVGLTGPKPLTRLTPEQLKPYLGLYQEEGTGRRIWVSKRKTRMMLELTGGAGALLPHWPDAEGRWEFGEAAAGIAVSFDKTSANDVSGMQLLVNHKSIRRYLHKTPAAQLPSVEHVMMFMQEKQGGQYLQNARTLELKGTLRAGATTFESVTLAEASERSIRRLTSAANSSITVVDGNRSRRKLAGQTIEELSGLHRDEALRINPFLRLQDWRKHYRDVQVVGVEKIGGEETWVVRMACEHTPPVTRYVGTKSGRLLKEETWTTAKGVGTVPLTVSFDDFREIAGVFLPFRITSESRLTGKQVTEIKDAKVNAPLDKDSFQLSQ